MYKNHEYSKPNLVLKNLRLTPLKQKDRSGDLVLSCKSQLNSNISIPTAFSMTTTLPLNNENVVQSLNNPM